MTIPPSVPIDPSARARKAGFGCGGCLLVLVIILAGAGITTLFSGWLGDMPDEEKIELTDMQQECVRIVAEWAGVGSSAVTSFNRSEGAIGWDFGGNYTTTGSSGYWECGGPAGQLDPSTVITFPGGVDSGQPPVTIIAD